MAKSISDLIMEFFQKHPKQDLKHGPVVDWVTKQYLQNHPEPPRDTWRAIRKLYQEGKLIKVKKGIYRYDPDYIDEVELFEEYCPDLKIDKMTKEDLRALLDSYSDCVIQYHPENYHQERGALLRNFEMLKRYGLNDDDYACLDFC